MPRSFPPTGLVFAPNLLSLISVVDEPAREIRQVLLPVVSVLLKSVSPVRQLAVANRLVIDEQLELLFAAFGRTYFFAAFRRTQLDGMPLIFLALWFHVQAPPSPLSLPPASDSHV